MNIFKYKKLIVTALTFVLVIILVGLPMPAKERRGATVVVTMTDGSQVKGELLAVKGHDLIIHNKFREQGFIVNIGQVSKIWIKRKSRFLSGLAIGLLTGVGLGAIWYACTTDRNDGDLRGFALILPSFATIPFGGLIGALHGVSEKLSIKEKEQAYIEECLQYLQQHAREQDRKNLTNPDSISRMLFPENSVSLFPDDPLPAAEDRAGFFFMMAIEK